MAGKSGSGRGSPVSAESNAMWERKLAYKEKEVGLELFKCIYWGIYIVVIASVLITSGYSNPNPMVFVGWAAVLLAIFLIIYGFVAMLHQKLLRKHS